MPLRMAAMTAPYSPSLHVHVTRDPSTSRHQTSTEPSCMAALWPVGLRWLAQELKLILVLYSFHFPLKKPAYVEGELALFSLPPRQVVCLRLQSLNTYPLPPRWTA